MCVCVCGRASERASERERDRERDRERERERREREGGWSPRITRPSSCCCPRTARLSQRCTNSTDTHRSGSWRGGKYVNDSKLTGGIASLRGIGGMVEEGPRGRSSCTRCSSRSPIVRWPRFGPRRRCCPFPRPRRCSTLGCCRRRSTRHPSSLGRSCRWSLFRRGKAWLFRCGKRGGLGG